MASRIVCILISECKLRSFKNAGSIVLYKSVCCYAHVQHCCVFSTDANKGMMILDANILQDGKFRD